MSKFLHNLLVQNFKGLVYSKNPIFIQKRIFLRFRPIWPSPVRAGPLCSAGHRIPAQPIRPKQPWRICRKVYFLRLCAFRQRHLLSLTSLPCGPCLSASSPSPCRPISLTVPLLLVASGHPAPPGVQHRDTKQGLRSPPGSPRLIPPPLTPH
jgi:hypothetical protein